MFPDITKCPEGGGELQKLLIENHYLKRTEGNDNTKQCKGEKMGIRNSRRYKRLFKKEYKIRAYLHDFLKRKFIVTLIKTL